MTERRLYSVRIETLETQWPIVNGSVLPGVTLNLSAANKSCQHAFPTHFCWPITGVGIFFFETTSLLKML